MNLIRPQGMGEPTVASTCRRSGRVQRPVGADFDARLYGNAFARLLLGTFAIQPASYMRIHLYTGETHKPFPLPHARVPKRSTCAGHQGCRDI